MLSCRASHSLRLGHQKLLCLGGNGFRVLQQALLGHDLPHSKAVRSDSFLFSAGCDSYTKSKEIHQRDGALKHFVRSFTDVHHRDGGDEAQILVPRLSEGEDVQVSDGELKLSRRRPKRYAVKDAFGSRKSPWIVPNTSKIEDPASVSSFPLKAIRSDSKTSLELSSINIKGRKLTKKFLGALQRKIELCQSASVPTSHLQLLLTKRAFLSASPERVEKTVEVLTEFFESRKIAFDVLTTNAGILEQPLGMLKRRSCVLAEFEVDRDACVKLGTTLGMWIVNVETIKRALAYLKGLGLDAQARSNMIRRRPILLRQTVGSLSATVDFFQSIGLSSRKLLKLLELRPSMFGASVENNLMVKFKLLRGMGLSSEEFARALKFISLYNNEHIIMRLNFLRDQGLTPESVKKILRLQPAVLGLSTQGLKAKLDFLVHTLDRNIDEVSTYPPYLGYSLEKRIVPRFKALEAVGLTPHGCLSGILSVTTSVFKQRFNIPSSVNC